MLRAIQLAMTCGAILVATPAQVRAGLITNGSLSVNIRNDNGAIDQVLFGGTDFFNPGTSVSNFGFQTNTNTGTFRRNTTGGATGQAVSVSGTNVVSGTYSQGGANVNFVRSYSLVPGLNVLTINTEFTNAGGDLTLSYFDTFDPDQGNNLGQGYLTYNDVFSLGGSTAGQARINSGGFSHTVIAGSMDPRSTVAAGNPFSIDSGTDLNGFFNSPFDGNDSFADEGLHIGLRTFIGSGDTTSFTYRLAFGLTPNEAQEAFVLANPAVPEPTSIAIFSFAALGLIARTRRRKMLQA